MIRDNDNQVHESLSARGQAHRPFLIGLGMLVAAAMLWSLNGALIKLIYQNGAGPGGMTIAFYRSLFAGLFLLPLMQARRVERPSTSPLPATRIWPSALLAVIFFTLMTVCFVAANLRTEAANAIILQYTSTFWVFGLSPWLLRERPEARDVRLVLLAMVGIAIIFAGQASTDLVGLLIALASGLFFGLLTVMLRRLRNVGAAKVTVWNNLGAALLLLVPVWLIGGLFVSQRTCVLLIFMGVVQLGIPYCLYSLGLKRVPAYQAAMVTMIEPVLVPVWTYLAVGETVPTTTVIGGAVILAALVLFVQSAKKGYKPSSQ